MGLVLKYFDIINIQVAHFHHKHKVGSTPYSPRHVQHPGHGTSVIQTLRLEQGLSNLHFRHSWEGVLPTRLSELLDELIYPHLPRYVAFELEELSATYYICFQFTVKTPVSSQLLDKKLNDGTSSMK